MSERELLDPFPMSGEDPGPARPPDDDPDFLPEPETPPLKLVQTTDAGAPPTDSLEDRAERAVLAAILEGHTVPAAVAELLDAGMFRLSRHQVLYGVLCDMAARKVPIDEITLLAQLDGQIDRVGGPEYIATLIGAVGNPDALPQYAGIVRDRAVRRWLAEAGRDLHRLAGDPDVPSAQLALVARRAEELIARTLREKICAQSFSPPLLADFAPETAAGPSWVVPGYAARAAVTLLAGLPKAGKTTFLADLVASVAAGATFLGRDVAGGRVLWIDLEQPEGLTKRVLDRHCFAGALVHVQHGRLPALDTAAAWCREQGTVLVVLDSLTKIYRAFGVEDENDPVQVERALQPLLEFARAANVALIILHHLRKSGGDEGLDVRGSGQIAAAVDIVVSLRRFGTDPDSPDSRRTLQAVSRFEETPRQLVVEYLDHRYRACGSVAQVRRQKERDQVIATVTAEPQTAEEIAAASGLAASAARTVLKELADDGVIARTGTGKRGDAFRYGRLCA